MGNRGTGSSGPAAPDPNKGLLELVVLKPTGCGTAAAKESLHANNFYNSRTRMKSESFLARFSISALTD
jgi:hypothetical protein